MAAWDMLGEKKSDNTQSSSWSGRTPDTGYSNYWVPSGCAINGGGVVHFNKASDGLGGSGYRLLCLNKPKYVMYLPPFNPSESEVISTCGAANSPGTAIASLEECVAVWDLLSLNPNNWVVVSGTPLAGDWSGRTPANGYDNYWIPSGCAINGGGVAHRAGSGGRYPPAHL